MQRKHLNKYHIHTNDIIGNTVKFKTQETNHPAVLVS